MTTGGMLKERFARIEGLDFDLALKNMGGQLPALVRVLRRFASTYREGLPVLLQASGSEHEVVFRWRLACHSARGASLAIGAAHLAQQIADLERELRDLNSRASFIAKGKEIHFAMADLVQRIALALAAS